MHSSINALRIRSLDLGDQGDFYKQRYTGEVREILMKNKGAQNLCP